MAETLKAETLRSRLVRYAVVAVILLTMGGIFLWQRIEERREAEAGDARAVLLRQQIEVDTPAPDFTLDTPTGRVRLADLRGRIVVLNFWATWCAPCKQEMPEFQALHEVRGADVTVLGVNATSTDSRDAATEFVRTYGFTFPIAFDTRGDVMRSYGVQGLPATFVIDRAGIVRARSLGPQDRVMLERNVRAAGG